MKALRKTLMGLATTALLTASAGTYAAILTDWFLDSDGAGANDPVLVENYLDLNGQSFTANDFTDATNFTFQEVGIFTTVLADGVTPISPALGSSFIGTGSGTAGGQLLFNTGTLTVTSGGLTIAVFDLVSGSGNLEGGTVLPNGPVSLIFQATSMEEGYFFDSGMNDLANLIEDELLFGFATTNARPIGTGTALTEASSLGGPLQTLYNNNFSPDVNSPIIDQEEFLLLSNNGQFQINVVPEPGIAALLGLGLLSACFAGRRRRVS